MVVGAVLCVGDQRVGGVVDYQGGGLCLQGGRAVVVCSPLGDAKVRVVPLGMIRVYVQYK